MPRKALSQFRFLFDLVLLWIRLQFLLVLLTGLVLPRLHFLHIYNSILETVSLIMYMRCIIVATVFLSIGPNS